MTTRKFGSHGVRHTEPLDSCFDLMTSHQHIYIVISSLEIEPATPDYRAKPLPVSYWSTSVKQCQIN